ncbi:conjugal transfer protein [Myroides profundi]|nr:conjugal transfer protein [Myroides profundi]
MMPLTSQMVSVAKSLAGLGALFYIGIKVWQALARAEAIDVYPMLRPFALGICIMFFPTLVLGTLNTVLSPVVKGTHQILETQVIDLTSLQKQKDILEKEAMLRNPEAAYLISDEAFDKKLDELGWSPSDLATMTGMYLEKWQYDFQKNLRDAFREILEMIFQASALIIDTIRTFFLIVLSILGPIAFAISIWSGFESTLLQWLTRYISVYLWLPVADLFSAMLARIQSLILERDMLLLSDPNFIPDTSNTIYVIFMIIGIVGYFTIPTVTSWIIQAGGAGNFMRNMNKTASTTANMATATAGASTGNIAGQLIKK